MPSTIRGMVALFCIKHNFYQEEQDQLTHGKEKSTVQKIFKRRKDKDKRRTDRWYPNYINNTDRVW